MKKKILISTGISTLAVVAGVTPAIVSNTNNQSVTIDESPNSNPNPESPNKEDPSTTPVDPGKTDSVNPTTPEDPDNPSELTSFATVPTADEFTYKINYFHSLESSDVDQYLQDLFAETNFFNDFKDSFKNNNEYNDVVVAYKPNSVNEAVTSFELSVTPVTGKTWSNKSRDSKTIKVNINNIEEPEAEAPKMGVSISYDNKIDGINIKNNTDLNNYLLKLFETDQSANLTIPEGSLNFKNVDVNYLSGSANFADKTFKVFVAPKDGYSWSESMESKVKYSSYAILVKITNFVSYINDAKAPQGLSFTPTVLPIGIKFVNDLNAYLVNFFKNEANYKSSLVPANSTEKLENVKLTYLPNTANLSTKTFKVSVKPIDGHAWENGTQNAVTLTAWINNFVSEDKLIAAPESFNSDLIINSQYDYSNGYYLNWNNINKFLDPDFTIGKYITNRAWWDSQAANYQKILADETFKNFSNYNPNIQIVSHSLGTISKDEYKGFVTRFTFNTVIKPKAGFYWKDGTTGNKTIPISFFCANIKNGAPAIGQYNRISDLAKVNAANWQNAAPAKSWVSKTIFNSGEFDRTYGFGAVYRKLNFAECQELILNHARDELFNDFPRWNITSITDPYSIKSGDPQYLYAPWKFKVTMKSMNDPKIIVQLDVFVIVRS